MTSDVGYSNFHRENLREAKGLPKVRESATRPDQNRRLLTPGHSRPCLHPSRKETSLALSPGELIEKRHAIFRHLSQKDIVPFPGDDSREFWQRAEERTQNTAKLYDELGMAEYQAIEVFLKLC